MKSTLFATTLLFGFVALLCGCTKRLPESEYLSFYEANCKSEFFRGGVTFYAMPLSADYEKVKWGTPLDSGMRVLFWATPRSNLEFENAFLISKKDSSAVVAFRKSVTFELGAADLFVLSFADKKNGAALYVSNVSHGIGGIEMNLENCDNIRLIEK
ncbi:hypothetical protein SAMN05720766_13217 [Fibrobacter sp. UWH9]|uniref:hypothetical protein n=1 Tax=Fibrobacter sp. UWH9 TaxID=1896213 RepID=UPI00092374B4|nr:hypothetical protein [Fibrobacter sp. UWH9]SHH87934.1 hypothetical protein SAMN05720766_13217 [Fibrobacter sp. UWH9]